MPHSSARVSCVLDTDIVVDFLRGQSYARDLLRDMAGHGVAVVSTVTQLEVFQAVSPDEEEATRTFLEGLMTMAVTIQIARVAGAIRKQMRAQAMAVPLASAIIAATAMHLDVPLVTNNADYSRFPGLRLRSPRSTQVEL